MTVIPELSPAEHVPRPNVIVEVVPAQQDGSIFAPYTVYEPGVAYKDRAGNTIAPSKMILVAAMPSATPSTASAPAQPVPDYFYAPVYRTIWHTTKQFLNTQVGMPHVSRAIILVWSQKVAWLNNIAVPVWNVPGVLMDTKIPYGMLIDFSPLMTSEPAEQ